MIFNRIKRVPRPIDVFSLVVRDWQQQRPGNKDFTFVQIGAHDGSTLDPIHHYVTKERWTGLLLEPQPRVFQRLEETYRGHDQLRLMNAAAGEFDGTMTLYAFKDHQGLPYHASMLTSSTRRHLSRNGHDYKGDIEELHVPVLSAETLRQSFDMAFLDLLQVDVEGADAAVVAGFIAAGVRPRIIHFESAWKPKAHRTLLGTLEDLGYGITETGINTVCYAQP